LKERFREKKMMKMVGEEEVKKKIEN